MPKSEESLESLAIRVKNGEPEFFSIILKRLDSEIKKLTSKYYIPGSDSEDTLQEAHIGIWKSVEDWSPTGGMSFKNFAINICCKRHIITAISAANRKKFDLLNTSISFSLAVGGGDDDNQQYFGDFLPDPNLSPQDKYIVDEEYEINSAEVCDKLTDLEKMIFLEYMKGQSYSDIAEILEIKTKTVDNALMRIRKKAATLWPMIDKKNNEN